MSLFSYCPGDAGKGRAAGGGSWLAPPRAWETGSARALPAGSRLQPRPADPSWQPPPGVEATGRETGGSGLERGGGREGIARRTNRLAQRAWPARQPASHLGAFLSQSASRRRAARGGAGGSHVRGFRLGKVGRGAPCEQNDGFPARPPRPQSARSMERVTSYQLEQGADAFHLCITAGMGAAAAFEPLP